MRMFNPPHPGLLLKEYLDNTDASITQIAKQLGVTRVCLSRIINEKSAITPEMALRLSQLLPNTTPKLWLGMQADFYLWQLEQRATFHIEPLFT